VTKKQESELVKVPRVYIGFVFQQFLLIPTLTEAENVGLPLIFSGKPYNRLKIDAILSRVGLSHRAGHLPSDLSGGKMQRVTIGRALVNDPASSLPMNLPGTLIR
jgi:putative ABC transport system ATP-binding protein